MTQVMVEETREMSETKIFKTIGTLSELLVVNFEEHAADNIEYGQVNCLESLAPYVMYTSVHNQSHVWGLHSQAWR